MNSRARLPTLFLSSYSRITEYEKCIYSTGTTLLRMIHFSLTLMLLLLPHVRLKYLSHFYQSFFSCCICITKYNLAAISSFTDRLIVNQKSIRRLLHVDSVRHFLNCREQGYNPCSEEPRQSQPSALAEAQAFLLHLPVWPLC